MNPIGVILKIAEGRDGGRLDHPSGHAAGPGFGRTRQAHTEPAATVASDRSGGCLVGGVSKEPIRSSPFAKQPADLRKNAMGPAGLEPTLGGF
jgi:hypothetical protein